MYCIAIHTICLQIFIWSSRVPLRLQRGHNASSLLVFSHSQPFIISPLTLTLIEISRFGCGSGSCSPFPFSWKDEKSVASRQRSHEVRSSEEAQNNRLSSQMFHHQFVLFTWFRTDTLEWCWISKGLREIRHLQTYDHNQYRLCLFSNTISLWLWLIWPDQEFLRSKNNVVLSTHLSQIKHLVWKRLHGWKNILSSSLSSFWL